MCVLDFLGECIWPSITRRVVSGGWTRYTEPMEPESRITVEPGKRGGQPCVRGLRITVYDVLDLLGSGMSEIEILADYPELEVEDLRACLRFAANRERALFVA